MIGMAKIAKEYVDIGLEDYMHKEEDVVENVSH